jgi:hypothetical protein
MVSRKTAAWILALLWPAASLAPAAAEGIYSCVDAKGRHLTADRPIPDCMDREQQELNPSGTVRRRLPPSPTAEERAREEEKARKAQQERARVAEEKKRNRALLARYPDKATHDRERLAALASADDVTAAAQKRATALAAERQKLDTELEFYRKDPSKIPARLKRQLEENEQQTAEQQRFIAGQEGEKKRINGRFDEELAKLRELWSAQPASTAAKAAPP